MPFERFHLLYDHKGYYNWDVPAKSESLFYSDGKTHEKLDRRNGHEVLYFLNYWSQKCNRFDGTLWSFHKYEWLLRKAPAGFASHVMILIWFRQVEMDEDHYEFSHNRSDIEFGNSKDWT